MGIKNLNKFLRQKCPEIFQHIHLSHYGFQRIAIDISLYMHKFKAIAGDRWLVAFLNLVASLRRNQIHCVFIFDGKSPPEKKEERAKRRREKEKLRKRIYQLECAVKEYTTTGNIPEILTQLWKRRRVPKRLLGELRARPADLGEQRIDMDWVVEKVKQKKCQLIKIEPKDFDIAKELFELLAVPYFVAPWEAEKMCARLCMQGLVEAVLSEDTDVIAYGAPTFLTKIDTVNDTAVAIVHKDILEALNLSKTQLLDLCIMCGTDYNANIFRVGAHTAYKRLQEEGSIDRIAINTTLDVTVLKHKVVQKLFTEFEDYTISSVPYCGTPKYPQLLQFLIQNEVWFNSHRSKEDNIAVAQQKLQEIKQDFKRTTVIFDKDM